MSSDHAPTIIALDFDGVICDGLIEYFQSAWRTYSKIWTGESPVAPPPDLAETFYRLRPVIETGWEMPVLIRCLCLGISEARIWQEWQSIAQDLLITENLDSVKIGRSLDQIRDNWISEDLTGWLSCHRLYPGVIEKLKSLTKDNSRSPIITTKEGRFVSRLLAEYDIYIAPELIYGKEVGRPKSAILRDLAPGETVWFVEDRLKTLQSVAQVPELDQVKLFLADWGYNTAKERATIADQTRIKLLSLAQFAGDFAEWL